MAHKEQIDYVNRIKNKFPEFFYNKKVLGVGSTSVDQRMDSSENVIIVA